MSEEKIKAPNKDYTIRCPRLGHQINFQYCRIENMGLPCFKILDCWFQHFDVESYLRQDLSSEEWDKTFNRTPKSKVASLLELIEKVKNSKQKPSP